MSVFANLLHLLAPLTANCREFHERWEKALPLGASGISGCWEGEWISVGSGHRGRLRCVVDPVSPALWRVHFRADYSKVFRACYSTDFNVMAEPAGWTFSGGADLGAFAGGAYEYAGTATLEALTCHYRSALDHGEFRLRRLKRT